MTVITSRRSKGPLGAGAMRRNTASTQRLEFRDDAPHRGRRQQTGRYLGSGQGGSGRLPLSTCSSNRTGETPPSG
jgi:hypothetical protein